MLLSHKKEWDLDICNNLDGPEGIVLKWSKSDKDTVWSYLYVESKNKTWNKQMLWAQRYREQIGGSQRQGLGKQERGCEMGGQRGSKGTNFRLYSKCHGDMLQYGHYS